MNVASGATPARLVAHRSVTAAAGVEVGFRLLYPWNPYYYPTEFAQAAQTSRHSNDLP